MPFKPSDRINYTPAPGGTTGQVQYNNDSVLDGATRVLVDNDDLVLGLSSSPAAPAADEVKVFGVKRAGRMSLAVKSEIDVARVMQSSLGHRNVQMLIPNGDGTTVTGIGTSASTVGTATAAATAVTNLHTASKRVEVAVTVASTSAVAGLRTSNLQHFIGTAPLGGFFMICKYGPSRGVSTSTHRSFCGMWASGSAPTDVEPSSLTSMFCIGYDAADTQFQFMHNDASGTATKVPLGASFPKPTADTTEVYEAMFYCPPGGPDIYYQFTNLTTGAVASGSVASDIPATTALLRPVLYNSVGGTSSVIGVSLMLLYIDSAY